MMRDSRQQLLLLSLQNDPALICTGRCYEASACAFVCVFFLVRIDVNCTVQTVVKFTVSTNFRENNGENVQGNHAAIVWFI